MPRVIVYHADYGCDTGCCGHVIQVDGDREEFVFDHPYGAYKHQGEARTEYLKQWARDLVREELGEEHVADLDWDNCVIGED